MSFINSLDRFLLFVALPAVILSAFVEALVLSWRGHFDWRAMGISLLDLVIRIALQIFLPLTIAAPFIALAYQYRLSTIAVDSAMMVAMLFLGQEFCYYWYHRGAHRIRWFWCNHQIHHSSNELNLSAALRIGILGRLTGTAFFYLPLVYLGFPPKLVFQMLSLNLLYQFWIHATWIPKLGLLEYVLNTPSAHRVHHAANLDYLDANYGGVLIVFDRLFGTYRAERSDEPCRYGLVVPMKGYNWFRMEFGPWVQLFKDLRTATHIRDLVGFIFRAPGWRPNGPSDRTEDLRARAGRTSPNQGDPGFLTGTRSV
jgi:sterol desaturase/sphingolipid hydroxylase (fatty acid hydroxylase superfamily)